MSVVELPDAQVKALLKSKIPLADVYKEWNKTETHQLVRVSGSTYCTREHDSLKISNGKWNWFSCEIGGKTALTYLIKVQDIPFIQEVEMLVGQAAVLPPVFHAVPRFDPPRKLLMPELNSNKDVVLNYLMVRGIHLNYATLG